MQLCGIVMMFAAAAMGGVGIAAIASSDNVVAHRFLYNDSDAQLHEGARAQQLPVSMLEVSPSLPLRDVLVRISKDTVPV